MARDAAEQRRPRGRGRGDAAKGACKRTERIRRDNDWKPAPNQRVSKDKMIKSPRFLAGKDGFP
ncbi:Predicted protein (fragment) [Bradyrhizobium sp. STM 3809]